MNHPFQREPEPRHPTTHDRRPARSGRYIALAMLVGTAIGAAPAVAHADAITDWTFILEENTTFPRTHAMAQIAAYDALNAIQRRNNPFAVDTTAPADTSPDAAVAAAQYTVLFALAAPPRRPIVQARYNAYLATIPAGPARDQGVALGVSVANQLLALPQYAVPATTPYVVRPPAPGVFQPTLPTPASGRATAVQPMFIPDEERLFFPDPPPALDSARYARDYNEVLSVGSATSTTRTAAQLATDQFWNQDLNALMDSAARDLSSQAHLDLWENSRLFTLLAVTAADGNALSFRSKYRYEFWRPITAIHGGDTDGNDRTTGDTTWRSLDPTPNNPEYIAPFSTQIASSATVFALFFGGRFRSFTVTQNRPPLASRTYNDFFTMIQEIISAPVYGGVQFRFSGEEGAELGARVGVWTFTHAFRPANGRWSFPAYFHENGWPHDDCHGADDHDDDNDD